VTTWADPAGARVEREIGWRSERRVPVGRVGVSASCRWRHTLVRVTRGSGPEGRANKPDDDERGGRLGVDEGRV